MRHWIQTDQPANLIRQDGDGIHNRGEPKPKLYENPKKLTNVSKKNIQDPEAQTQTCRKQDLNCEHRKQSNERPTWKVIRQYHKERKETKNNTKIQ